MKLKDIGKFDTVPELAQHIYEGNIEALCSALAAGWDIEQGIELSRHVTCSPLDIAIVAEQLGVVKLLCEHGANLNAAGRPAFLTAVRYCGADIVRYVAANGARLDAVNNVKSGAYEQAYYGNKTNIPLIMELGLDITKHGGKTLRNAVDKHDLKTVAYLLEHGVDINFNEPDMVYPYRATPLTVAARSGNLKMVKYLVERGADVTLAEKDGERAYTIAVSSKYTEMANYLKAIEPPEFHQLENKLYALKSYKLPKDIMAFLCGDQLRLELTANEYGMNYVEFFSLTDVIEMKVGRQKLLRLSSVVDNYGDILIVWNPKQKCIGYYDVEHQVYADVCSFAEFLLQPEVHLAQIIEAELNG